MSDYFTRTQRSSWSMENAFNSFSETLSNDTLQQRLDKFHNSLINKSGDNIIDDWLKNWQQFYQKINHSSCPSTSSGSGNRLSSSSGKKVEFIHQMNKIGGHAVLNNCEFNGQIEGSSKRQSSEDNDRDRASKRREITPSTDSELQGQSDQIPVNKKISVWEYWKKFLEANRNNQDIFKFSPVRHGVVRIGHKLANNIDTPLDLYLETLGQITEEKPYNLRKHGDYIDTVLDSASLTTMKSNVKQNVQEQDLEAKLVKSICKAAYNVYNPDEVCISHSESNFNFILLHPVLKALSKSIANTNFFPGEEKLESMVYCNKLIDSQADNKSLYNADAVLRSINHNNIELLILETAFQYANIDKTKYALDNLKAMFGLLSMFKLIADTYRYATRTTLYTLKVYFIQAYNLQIYVWSLSLSPCNDYVLLLENKSRIPFRFEKKEEELFDFIGCILKLRTSILTTMKVLDELKKEHTNTLKAFRYNKENIPVGLNKIVNPSIVRIANLKSGQAGLSSQAPGGDLAI